MNTCYLALGSNQKHPERQIRKAIKHIHSLPSTCVFKKSDFYWNKAWGLEAQQDFCNAVIEIKTTLPPLVLLKKCKAIEKRQGRVRGKRYGPRIIDIDIILYGTRTMDTNLLTIPHPSMKERDFVMQPLSEITP